MTQEKVRRFQFLDYAPPIVAFVAAIAAVVGSPKWDTAAPGVAKITPFGWFVLGIGLLALVTSLLVTSSNKREQVRQRETKNRIESIGMHQLLRAFQHAVHPIASDSIWRRQCEAPESPLPVPPAKRLSFSRANFWSRGVAGSWIIPSEHAAMTRLRDLAL